jgi:hypothetical protein
MLDRNVKAPGTRPALPIEVERDYSRHPIPGQLALWLPADARGDRPPLSSFTAFSRINPDGTLASVR